MIEQEFKDNPKFKLFTFDASLSRPKPGTPTPRRKSQRVQPHFSLSLPAARRFSLIPLRLRSAPQSAHFILNFADIANPVVNVGRWVVRDKVARWQNLIPSFH